MPTIAFDEQGKIKLLYGELGSSGGGGGSGGTTVESITDGETITLASDTIYTGGEIATLTVAFPNSPTAAFIAETDFTSGTTPTTLTYPTGIKWTGDDLTSNEFVPVASKRYNVIWWYDGVNWNANASARI